MSRALFACIIAPSALVIIWCKFTGLPASRFVDEVGGAAQEAFERIWKLKNPFGW